MIAGGRQVLEFSPTQLVADAVITILDDDIFENYENFSGLLSNPSEELVNLAPASASVTIFDANDGKA